MSEEIKLVGTMDLGRILGVSHTAVAKAAKSGRISVAKLSDSGRPLFDPETCKAEWEKNTQAIMQRGESSKGGRPRANTAHADSLARPEGGVSLYPDELAPGATSGATDLRANDINGEQRRINANMAGDGDDRRRLESRRPKTDSENPPDEGGLVDENGVPNLNRATATEKYYKALKAKLDYEEAIGKLVSIEAVAKIVEQEYARVRARLLAIPSKLAPDVALIDDVSLCRSQIEAMITDALSELSADHEAVEQVAA